MPPVSADGIIDWLARPFAIDRSTRAWRSVRGTGLGRKPGSGRPVAFLTSRHQAATRIPECLKYTPKMGSGATHMVRYVPRKGSHGIH
jgi:hypothetical protein